MWQTGEGECCGGVWQTGEGECCGGVWYAAGESQCPEGQIFLRWGEQDECCGCVPDTILDGRVGEEVATASVVDDLCCTCDGFNFLPYTDFPNVVVNGQASPAGTFTGCRARCCVDGGCTQEFQGDCVALEGQWLGGCCDLGCPAPCCSEDADGTVQCEVKDSGTCEAPDVIGSPDCETGCLGECCLLTEGVYVSQGQTTQPACDAIGGQWAGLGSTSCSDGTCRDPFTENCCETKQSSAAGLTFTQPRRKRLPPFSDTVRVTVTGTTDSRILIHGTPFGEDADPSKRCPINHSFLLCWDEFSVEPVPCGTNFRNVDLTVCWAQEATDTEALNFSGCNGLTLPLGNCPYDCVTTLVYSGGGHTSDSDIVLYGDAVVEANGAALVLTSAITIPGSCVEKLTLTGTSTALNEIGVIPNSSSGLAVEKTGPGTWRMAGLNTFTDGLTVSDGTIVAGNSFSGSGSSVGNGSVVVGSASGGISGTAALLFENDAIVDRSVTIAALGVGSSQVAILGGWSNGLVIFDGSGSITLNRSVTLQAATGGTVNFAKPWVNNGPATVVTIGSAGNAGTIELEEVLPSTLARVNIQNGTGKLVAYDDRIDPATPVTIGAAVLDINGQSQTLSDLTFAVGAGTITGGTLRLAGTVAATGTGHAISSAVALDAAVTFSGSGSLLVSGVVSGSNSLTKTGTGTLTLSGANTHTGTTTISGGTVVLSGTLAATSQISIGTATLECTGSTKSANAVAITGTATQKGSMTVGTLSGSGSLTHDGGALTLTNASTLTGTLTIASGSLVLNAIVSGSGVTSATFTPSSLTVAFSAAPATGDQFVLLAGATAGTYSVTLTGTVMTGTYNSSTSTLTIN